MVYNLETASGWNRMLLDRHLKSESNAPKDRQDNTCTDRFTKLRVFVGL